MLDVLRIEASKQLDSGRKAELGQFMTTSRVAYFMASMFRDTYKGHARLLDPGAGIGSLTAAFLDRMEKCELRLNKLEVVAYEVEHILTRHLRDTMASYSNAPARRRSIESHRRDTHLIHFNGPRFLGPYEETD